MIGQELKSISQFAKDLIKDSNGVLSKVEPPSSAFIGRKTEVESVVLTLYKKRMRNCVIVGNSGAGKTEIARKAIQKMKGDCLFLNMNVGALQSGCTLVGQFEKKLLTIINSIASYNSLSKDKKVCLFVDEVHALWSVGRNQISGSVSAADIIKPYLSNGTIIILGATTEEEYEEFLMKDKALLRRVSPIFIDDMGPEDTKSVIESFCDGELDDSMLNECVERSLTIEGAHNPDCAIEIADRAMARALYFKRLVQPQDIDIAAKGLAERRKDG